MLHHGFRHGSMPGIRLAAHYVVVILQMGACGHRVVPGVAHVCEQIVAQTEIAMGLVAAIGYHGTGSGIVPGAVDPVPLAVVHFDRIP